MNTREYGARVMGTWQPTPAPQDDLSQVVSIAMGGRSALVVMTDGRKMLFKVSDAVYLRDLDKLARSMSKPYPVAHNGPLVYKNEKIA